MPRPSATLLPDTVKAAQFVVGNGHGQAHGLLLSAPALVHVALQHGERSEVAYVLPLSVDGVLTIAAIVMAEDRRTHHPVRLIAKTAFLVGVSASVAANIAAAHPTLGGRLIAAWPAIALLLIVEMLVYPRPAAASPMAGEEPFGDAPGDQDARISTDSGPATQPAEQHPEPHRKFRRVAQPPNGTTQRRRPITVTRQLAAELLLSHPDLTREQIAAQLGISTRRLRTILAAAPDTNSTTPSRTGKTRT